MSLRIVIFGASGATGQLLTQQALAGGHQATAVVRRPEEFGQQHANLDVVRGDVYDAASVAAAIKGQDAVLSVVGVPYSWKAITTYSRSATTIVQSMHDGGVRRLIMTSSGGTNPHYDPAEGFFFGRLIKSTIGRSTYADMRAQEAMVMESNLEWTIVRPARLVTHPTVTAYAIREAYIIPGKLRTARADLVDFMLSQIGDDQYKRKAVAIASDV
jgi:putative NADH-flavin reductase